MSSVFARLNYDNCFQNDIVKQSTGPGNYKLFTGQTDNKSACHSLNGSRNDRTRNSSELDKGATMGDRADIESTLTNRDEPASRCLKKRTLSEKNKKLQRELQKGILCDNFLNYTHTRLENPIDDYRGLSTISLQVEYPLINPEENVFYGHNSTILKDQNMNSRYGRSTRLEAKDLYSSNFESNNKVEITKDVMVNGEPTTIKITENN